MSITMMPSRLPPEMHPTQGPTRRVSKATKKRRRIRRTKWRKMRRSTLPHHLAPSRKKQKKPGKTGQFCCLMRLRATRCQTAKYPLGESNPCLRTENPMSWATRRRGLKKISAGDRHLAMRGLPTVAGPPCRPPVGHLRHQQHTTLR